MKTILAALIFLFYLPAPVPGQRVYDFASYLSETNKQELEALIAETENQTTAQLSVVIIDSLNGEDIDSYANTLFNSWGIGQKGVNNGVLFLIAPHERRTRIEVGYGLEPLITDALAGEILDNEVIPFFKQDKISEGIVNGSKEILSVLQNHPQAARGIAGSAPGFIITRSKKTLILAFISFLAAIVLIIFSFFFGKKRTYSGILLMLAIASFIAVLIVALICFKQYPGNGSGIFPLIGAVFTGLFALIHNIKRYRRFGPHFCSKCSTQMNLLDEVKDDAELSTEEVLEENLQSVDYDVWHCPACLNKEIQDYVSLFSKYSRCSECKRRTYSEITEVLVSATYSSGGSALVTGTCKSCGFQNQYTRILPRLQRSSSSGGGSGGGGSFGGGSSGGGGSSRGW